MESSLLAKAKTALQAAAAKAERTITEMKADLKADFSKPVSPIFSPLFRGCEGKGELPWIGKSEVEKRHEAEFRQRILEIPKKPEEYLLQEHDEGSMVDMRAAMQSAGAVLECDEELRNLRFLYVPKKMKEQEFWRRYFIAVRSIKQEILELDPDLISETPIGIVHRRCSSEAGSNEADSPKKDPSEEEAYKRAFTVVAIPPSMLLRRLASAAEVGRTYKTMKELAQGYKNLDKDHPSNSGEWTGLATGLAMMRKLSNKDGKPKNQNNVSGSYNSLLWSLFETDTQYEEKDIFVESSVSARTRLPEEVHGAPPESFVARLAEIMGGIKSEQKMAEFWLEVIKELRRRWFTGQPISRMPVDLSPDLRYCLLHQQIQLINCCMARRKRRAFTLASLQKGQTRGNETPEITRILSDSPGAVPTNEQNTKLYVKQKNGDLLLRLGADHPAADLRMLETGEAIYSPVTQEGPVLTEDLIQETEELVLRTGSVGAGCSHLLSDMQAFKAANPGCILEDFVRWYSPLDWREGPCSDLILTTSVEDENVADIKASARGYLSARMQCKGNLWQELWTSARPIPAVKQAPLFDEELAGESTLDALENVAPFYLFEQLFTSALSAGFAIVEGSPAAKRDPLKNCLKECTDYIISTCGRGMSAEKLEHLCEVYEVMEATVHVPPQDVQEARVHHVDSTSEALQYTPSEIACESRRGSEGENPPEKLLRRKSAPDIFQNVKGDNIFSRLMEVKVSFFEKKNLRPAFVEERKQSISESDWTIV
ncbi:Rab3 GTPase-activating protein catalytic subunit [Marchantia polymorpha subsp. ruderalis]|uniref:BSD domain-containing protein n=1 Tax=Marchantia polymorpha TaxID=3197 RepID=A0A2R6XDK4_MARPO|nr:hypothetical protein MARPO_0021s0054 [Marchantia polymorpha]BBN01260.1 hypothetical protein Mp_2g05990 [Marchantia polymorpha subsp. ruderalis]|eukprot:PTQ44185.1 hypothetical protein MARPO_0021s0054 [Marchantia polymorpha]